MPEKKRFIEPEIVKCEESLDKVTLCLNQYKDENDCHYDRYSWRRWWSWWQ